MRDARSPVDWRRPGLAAVLLAQPFALAAVAIAMYLARTYSLGTFVIVPLTGGFVTLGTYHLYTAKPLGRSLGTVVLSCLTTFVLLLLAGLEGAVCIAMAAPLALPMYLLGAVAAHLLGRTLRGTAHRALSLLLAPLCAFALMGMEHAWGPSPSERAVHSAVIVDASPEAIWDIVVAFPPIPAPEEGLFRTGIAYPTHAEIDGQGVGAVRRCHFSTGAFVEPITHWEPPHRLAFDVTEQPHPMREWSPYSNLHPPHLDTGLRALRGEFRIVPLDDGTTRLEGTTWYRIHFAPEAYWGWISDAIIHAIHLRVLDHIRQHAEHAG